MGGDCADYIAEHSPWAGREPGLELNLPATGPDLGETSSRRGGRTTEQPCLALPCLLYPHTEHLPPLPGEPLVYPKAHLGLRGSSRRESAILRLCFALPLLASPRLDDDDGAFPHWLRDVSQAQAQV